MNVLQLAPEEHAAARQHRLTASRAADLLSGNYKTWNHLARNMREPQRILGKKCGVPSLDWGVDNERQIRAWTWERHPEWHIMRGGFIPYHDQSHPLFAKHCGCTPDGIIHGYAGREHYTWGYEAKAPYDPEIHLSYVRKKQVPEKYWPQVQFSLWCAGPALPVWVFATGDPRVAIADEERYFDTGVVPDPEVHARISDMASRFLEGYTAGEEFRPLRATAAAFDKMF